jgi:hypothetical protein
MDGRSLHRQPSWLHHKGTHALVSLSKMCISSMEDRCLQTQRLCMECHFNLVPRGLQRPFQCIWLNLLSRWVMHTHRHSRDLYTPSQYLLKYLHAL